MKVSVADKEKRWKVEITKKSAVSTTYLYGKQSSKMPAKKKDISKDIGKKVEKIVEDEKDVSQSRCIIAKCPSFPEVHKMIIRWEKTSRIISFLLEKDEMIKDKYEWLASDVAFKRLFKVFENFRSIYYGGKWYIPSFMIEAYKIQKEQFNEVEDMETLLWLMLKRLDMYHELEQKGGIPMKDVAENVETTKDLIEALLRMKQSLWISEKVADKIEVWVEAKVSENFEKVVQDSKNPKEFLEKLFKTKL